MGRVLVYGRKRKRLQELWAQGIPRTVIARRLGISFHTVRYWTDDRWREYHRVLSRMRAKKMGNKSSHVPAKVAKV